MATKHSTQLIDDIDGSVLEDEDGQQVTFSVGNCSYEIDLSDSNAADLRRAFAPYVEAARSRGTARVTQSRRPSQPKGDTDATIVRKWARANGFTVSDRGRVSTTVEDAYKLANA